MSRSEAITSAARHFDDGSFLADLARRVAIPTTSQEPENFPQLNFFLLFAFLPGNFLFRAVSGF